MNASVREPHMEGRLMDNRLTALGCPHQARWRASPHTEDALTLSPGAELQGGRYATFVPRIRQSYAPTPGGAASPAWTRMTAHGANRALVPHVGRDDDDDETSSRGAAHGADAVPTAAETAGAPPVATRSTAPNEGARAGRAVGSVDVHYPTPPSLTSNFDTDH